MNDHQAGVKMLSTNFIFLVSTAVFGSMADQSRLEVSSNRTIDYNSGTNFRKTNRCHR